MKVTEIKISLKLLLGFALQKDFKELQETGPTRTEQDFSAHSDPKTVPMNHLLIELEVSINN